MKIKTEQDVPRACPNAEWHDGRGPSRRFASGTGFRMHKWYCDECGWESEAFTPTPIPVELNRWCQSGGWHYESFDQYGYMCTCSVSYRTKKECIQKAQKELDRVEIQTKEKWTAFAWPGNMWENAIEIKPTTHESTK